jgi:hypothetical protein
VASLRPWIVNRSWTPLSLRKRISRTGPAAVMPGGIVFEAPASPATAICGFVKGLVPPIAG